MSPTKLIFYATLISLLLTACGPRSAPSVSTQTPFQPETSGQGPSQTQLAEATAPTTGGATSRPPQQVSPTPGRSQFVSGVRAYHRSGQTFITWEEHSDLNGEVYRVYRSNRPIQPATLDQAVLIGEVGKDSANLWATSYSEKGSEANIEWYHRYVERMVLEDNAAQVASGTGALVWTLSPEDFGGQADQGEGYYAVTFTPQEANSPARLTDAPPEGSAAGPVKESVAEPLPVEITGTPGVEVTTPGVHYYLQYMDLHHWNPTFHAPNPLNNFYGRNPADPNLTHALVYTYDYSIFAPDDKRCGGQAPNPAPVLVFLHGARLTRYPPATGNPYPYCAYDIYPVDLLDTWYYGFTRDHDYRAGGPFRADDVVENYTEQRVLRMVYDLLRQPPGPAIDRQRIYLYGHSMGGTGSLAMAERYPNVFAAAYSGQPVTNFRTTPGVDEPWPGLVANRWGPQDAGSTKRGLPIHISAPGNWAAHLQKYNGTPVFDWQDLRAAFNPKARPDRTADEMVPFSIDHGTTDDAVLYPSQARPLYPLLIASPRAWGGAITVDAHNWSYFGWPLPNLAVIDSGLQYKSKPIRGPFWNFKVVHNETVPGLSNLAGAQYPGGDPPKKGNAPNEVVTAVPVTTFHLNLLWSASWNAWDGPPVDKPDEWQMSFCATALDQQQCGSGPAMVVDVTPRRVQHFVITPGQTYQWEVRRISDSAFIDGGTATAGKILTIPKVQVWPEGVRLRIWK